MSPNFTRLEKLCITVLKYNSWYLCQTSHHNTCYFQRNTQAGKTGGIFCQPPSPSATWYTTSAPSSGRSLPRPQSFPITQPRRTMRGIINEWEWYTIWGGSLEPESILWRICKKAFSWLPLNFTVTTQAQVILCLCNLTGSSRMNK